MANDRISLLDVTSSIMHYTDRKATTLTVIGTIERGSATDTKGSRNKRIMKYLET